MRLTENFANAHPNLTAFVEVIRKEFKYYEERFTEKRQNGSRIRYEHPENEKSPIINCVFYVYKEKKNDFVYILN
ncbi:hypothetical protein HZS_2703 [Henneguya salminicola]|nr:hypothetical protein HZS_2703 [Henneguya salminicola]